MKLSAILPSRIGLLLKINRIAFLKRLFSKRNLYFVKLNKTANHVHFRLRPEIIDFKYKDHP